jgi:hypothetical protein
MPVIPLLLLALSSRAAEPAWYDPDAVAGASKAFARIAELMGPAFQDAERQTRTLSKNLAALDSGVALLGERAPDGMAAWASDVRRQATGQHLRLQRHLELLQDDTVGEFQGALQRAIPAVAGPDGAKECGRSGVQAMMGKGPQCAGKNISAALAGAMDADPALNAAVDEIRDIPWPKIELPTRTWAPAPVTGSASWVATAALERAFLRERITAHQDDLSRAVDPLESRIADGDAAALDEAQRHRATYEAALAADGAAVVKAMGVALEAAERKGGPKAVGVCANPRGFGGCEGRDATRELVAWLKSDKRFARELAKALPER